jgi:hypothetical protein
MNTRIFTFYDLIIIFILIAASLLSIPYLNNNRPSTVIIYKDNNIYAKYPLNKNREITVNGYHGPMNIEILNGRIRIVSSTCQKQICVNYGYINKSFQQLICVPNHILIEIQSKNGNSGFDAIAK